MTRFTTAVALLLAASVAAASATEEEAVLAAVQKFFDTMAARDVEGAREVLVPEGRFFRHRVGAGKNAWSSFTNEEYLDGLAGRENDVLERMWDAEVRVHQGIATVWTRYDFYVNGELSHCGIDAFDLVKTEGEWKISGGSYTVERSGCPESPLGPP